MFMAASESGRSVKRTVSVLSPLGPAGRGELSLVPRTSDERVLRTLKALLWGWAGRGLDSVGVLGDVVSVATETARVLEGAVPCPGCAQSTPVDGQPAHWPLRVWCKTCGIFLEVKPESDPRSPP